MVDLVRQARVLLAERIVRQLGEVGDGVEALQVFGGDRADILRQDHRARNVGRIQPAGAVEAGIETDRFNAALKQIGAEKRTNVAVSAGKKNFHGHGM